MNLIQCIRFGSWKVRGLNRALVMTLLRTSIHSQSGLSMQSLRLSWSACHPTRSQGSLLVDAYEWTLGSTIRRTKYRQTSLYGHPINTDTPLIRTLSMVPSVSVLTGFDWTVLLKSRLQISIRWYSGQELQNDRFCRYPYGNNQVKNHNTKRTMIWSCRTRICETGGKCKRSRTSYRYTHQGDINRY